jgi:hypothetical protein
MGEKEMEGVLYFKNGDGTSYSKVGVLKAEDLTPEINDEVYRTFDNTRTFSCTAQLNPADMHKLDVLVRPYVICCNPKDELLFEEYKKKGFIIHADTVVEEGMCYIIDRNKLDPEDDLW